MKKYYLNALNEPQIKNICKRPANNFGTVFPVAKTIIEDVRKNGDKAVRRYIKEFDDVTLEKLGTTQKEIKNSYSATSPAFKRACAVAYANIEKFHRAQVSKMPIVETIKGVRCWREARPIEKVGLYIPGGTAPLPSTVLMLGIPAKIAGCKEIILCTPPQKDSTIPDSILFAAWQCGITKIFKVGGAQAIAAMAYGTETIPKVDKIFGPGNRYVTAAKMLTALDPKGAAIDLPAGPTELLVIADKYARPDFVASDLLSQAEHGVDSQVVLVATDNRSAKNILAEVKKQLVTLPRREIAAQALEKSFVLIASSVEEAIIFSNAYAPEHLIMNMSNPERYLKRIINAGSVFIGQYSCESAGDYASGPNHTLPTYGYARAYSGVSVDSFIKQVTFQKLTREGARRLKNTVSVMAEVEGLEGHKRAIEIR